MRFLLISDTHGKFGGLHDLAARTKADAVIHAGDFGFYDQGSYEQLSDRELRLQIIHSDLPPSEKTRLLALTRNAQIQAAKASRVLGEFSSYVSGEASFRMPVYAVWGNHEDKAVVERLVRGETIIHNLHLLNDQQMYRVGPALVYGLGGNFLPGSKLLQTPIAGGGGKIWSTLSQYADLVKTADRELERPGLRLFVSHVSPGKEPFVEFLGARTRADFTISGHMGAPTCMVWNSFAIHSVDEAVQRLQRGFEAVKHACQDPSQPITNRVGEAWSLIEKLPEDTITIGRGMKAPRWYRGMTHVNLPDAHVGYALMDVTEHGATLQTFTLPRLHPHTAEDFHPGAE